MNTVLKDALGGGFQNLFGEGIKIPDLTPVATNANTPASSSMNVGKTDSLESIANKTPAPVPLVPILN